MAKSKKQINAKVYGLGYHLIKEDALEDLIGARITEQALTYALKIKSGYDNRIKKNGVEKWYYIDDTGDEEEVYGMIIGKNYTIREDDIIIQDMPVTVAEKLSVQVKESQVRLGDVIKMPIHQNRIIKDVIITDEGVEIELICEKPKKWKTLRKEIKAIIRDHERKEKIEKELRQQKRNKRKNKKANALGG